MSMVVSEVLIVLSPFLGRAHAAAVVADQGQRAQKDARVRSQLVSAVLTS